MSAKTLNEMTKEEAEAAMGARQAYDIAVASIGYHKEVLEQTRELVSKLEARISKYESGE